MSQVVPDRPEAGVDLPVRRRAVQAGWICLGVGIVLMFTSLATFPLYGALFFAAFVLSIVGMAQGRVGGGILLLLTTIALPTTLWLGLFAVRFSDAMKQQEQQKAVTLSRIEFEDVEGYIDGNFMYLKGKVRNNGTAKVDFVKVGIEWLDASEKVLDTDFTYAVSSEGLSPGNAKSFTIMTEADRRMKRFRYFIKTD